jgi:ribosomal protein L24E
MDAWYHEFYGKEKKKTCAGCGKEIEPGTEVVFYGRDGTKYTYCPTCTQ